MNLIPVGSELTWGKHGSWSSETAGRLHSKQGLSSAETQGEKLKVWSQVAAGKPTHLGHMMQRADSLEKSLMLGKIEGGRRRGQQRMRWLDGQ